MHTIKIFIRRFSRFLATGSFVTMGFLALATFVAAITEPGTPQKPEGLAGVAAALIALFTAGMLTAQAMGVHARIPVRIQRFAIGVGATLSGYSWVASESEIHPSEPILLGIILLMVVLAALATIIVPLALFASSDYEEPCKHCKQVHDKV